MLLWCSNSPVSQSECTLLLKAGDTNVCKLNGTAPAHAGLFINLKWWKDTSRLPPCADSNQARWPIAGWLCKRLKMIASQYSYASLEAEAQDNTLHAAPNGNQSDWLTGCVTCSIMPFWFVRVDQNSWCKCSISIYPVDGPVETIWGNSSMRPQLSSLFFIIYAKLNDCSFQDAKTGF